MHLLREFKLKKEKDYLFLISLFIIFHLMFAKTTNITTKNDRPGIVENHISKIYSECTTALFSGFATPDGRPLLWKNRDVNSPNQEYHYVDDGRIPFIGLTYCNDTTFQYYAGVNAAGFAIENSNSYNLGPGVNRNGWGSGDDDGEIQTLALATCRTIEDFQLLLDSLDNAEGRTHTSNYGTFDAFGGAAIFEAAARHYFRHDAADDPNGFLVRSNYSYSGNGLDNRVLDWGPSRHDIALELIWNAANEDNLTPQFLLQNVVRNLASPDMDDYELPYGNYHQNREYGCVSNRHTICRDNTQSVFIAQGVREGEHPDNSLIWSLPGNPYGCPATPLWVGAGSVPIEHNDRFASRLCVSALAIRSWVTDSTGINTFKLHNDDQNAYWDWMFPLEDWVFSKVTEFRYSPRFSYDRLESFQNLIASQVADSIDNWQPVIPVTDQFELYYPEGRILIFWEPVEDDFRGWETEAIGYNVFRNETPFREGARGDFIGFTEDPVFTDETPFPCGAYYRIEVVF